MQILRSISLDFGRKSEYKTVYAKRYEAMNSSLEISLLNYGESFNLGSNMTAKMQLLKPDGKLVVAECTKNYGGAADKILVEFPIQAFAVPGIGRAEIALYRNGSFLSAQKFYIEIEDNEVADAFSSSNEFRALDEALYQVGTVISSAEEAAGTANIAASNANSAAAAANAASSNANAAASSANNAANAADTAANRVAVMINNANTVISDASQAAGNANAAAESANEAKDAANEAKDAANAAAASASAAASDAENVNIAAVQTATGADITTTDRDGAETTVHITDAPSIFTPDTSSWQPVTVFNGSEETWTAQGEFWNGAGNLVNTQYTQRYISSAEKIPIAPNASYEALEFYGAITLYDENGQNGQQIQFTNANIINAFETNAQQRCMGVSFLANAAHHPKESVIIKRITITQEEYDALPIEADRVKPLYGKKVVCFGDSLFGTHRGAASAPAYAAKECGATVFNVGFGGCRMAVHPTPGYAEFSMWALAKAVSENDFAAQDAGAVNGSAYFPEQLAVLKGIDFSTADIAVIHYGTNDFVGGVPLDNINNAEDYDTVCGALRYSVNKLLTAYPKLQIYVSLPCYRYWTDGGTTTFAEDYTNSNGIKLSDVCNALKDAAKALNLPVIDGFSGLGINKFNASLFLEDGTHHNENGRERFGRFIGACIAGKGR